jgi:predicted RNA-binding Zn-ribbon protein involved in translation (DUF1610 family)
MSATNRGAARVEDDFYVTPAWCVHRLLEAIAPLGIPSRLWHEVTAGDGAIIKAANAYLGDQSPAWAATELRDYPALSAIPNVKARMPCDYLTALPVAGVDFIITNPPFSIAEQVIKKAITEAAWVAMLLRTNFKGGPRSSWLRHEMPDDYQLPERPSFIASYKCKPRDQHDKGCGWELKTPTVAAIISACPQCGRKVQRSTSDSAEYSWFLFTPERGRSVGQSRILASTPAEARKVIREAA